jgi:hypothetical protein
MLIVRTTTSPGSLERSCSQRRVSMSQIGVSSEFATFRMRIEPSDSARVTPWVAWPSNWSRVKSGAISLGLSLGPITVNLSSNSYASPARSSIVSAEAASADNRRGSADSAPWLLGHRFLPQVIR